MCQAILLLTKSECDLGILNRARGWPRTDTVFIACDQAPQFSSEPVPGAKRLLGIVTLRKKHQNTAAVRAALNKLLGENDTAEDAGAPGATRWEVLVGTHSRDEPPESVLETENLPWRPKVVNYSTVWLETLSTLCDRVCKATETQDQSGPDQVARDFDAVYQQLRSPRGSTRERRVRDLLHALEGVWSPLDVYFQGWEEVGYRDDYWDDYLDEQRIPLDERLLDRTRALLYPKDPGGLDLEQVVNEVESHRSALNKIRALLPKSDEEGKNILEDVELKDLRKCYQQARDALKTLAERKISELRGALKAIPTWRAELNRAMNEFSDVLTNSGADPTGEDVTAPPTTEAPGRDTTNGTTQADGPSR